MIKITKLFHSINIPTFLYFINLIFIIALDILILRLFFVYYHIFISKNIMMSLIDSRGGFYEIRSTFSVFVLFPILLGLMPTKLLALRKIGFLSSIISCVLMLFFYILYYYIETSFIHF